jgi:hypothetical protein
VGDRAQGVADFVGDAGREPRQGADLELCRLLLEQRGVFEKYQYAVVFLPFPDGNKAWQQ